MVDDDKFIMLNMDDPNLKKISEVLSNKTAKKIIDFLSEKSSASEKDLSDNLKIPLNTIEYNLKKLVEAGIVKKHKNFFWSKKGKKIIMYELSNKSIVISPWNSNIYGKLKSLVPGFLVVVAGSFVAYVYEKLSFGSERVVQTANEIPKGVSYDSVGVLEEASYGAVETVANTSSQVASSPLWMWFLFGGLIALGIVALVNWRRL
jgi:DNA-binding transcriptional ArsR family regulator